MAAAAGAETVVVDALYAIAGAVVDLIEASPPFPWWLLALVLGGIPAVALHEAGHALAAVVLLDTAVDVEVGTAGRLAELRLGRVRAELNAFAPGARAGSATFDAARATARDVLLIAIAGPLASIAGLIVSAAVLAQVEDGSLVHALLWGAAVTSVWGVLNLIPFTLTDRHGLNAEPSDGRLALDAFSSLRRWR